MLSVEIVREPHVVKLWRDALRSANDEIESVASETETDALKLCDVFIWLVVY